MRGDKAAGFAGFWSPVFSPLRFVGIMLQPSPPLVISERSRINRSWHRLATPAPRFIVIAAGIKPTRRIRNEFPPVFGFIRPSRGERAGSFHQGRQSYQGGADNL